MRRSPRAAAVRHFPLTLQPNGAAAVLARACSRGGPGQRKRREMYVKIMCLQDALYKAIKLSASETSHGGRGGCLW